MKNKIKKVKILRSIEKIKLGENMKKLLATCFFVFTGLFIYMYAYAETVSISGAVTQFSSSSGLALNDIIIDVTGTKTLKVKTGRTGNYIIAGLEKGGTYTLRISKPGYTFTPETKVFKNLEESKINQDFVAASAKYSISGKVIVGGKPAKGVIVMINNRPIKYYTDDNGEYVIDNLEYNGPYEVKVVSDKYAFNSFKTEFLEKNVVHDFKKDITLAGRVTSSGEGLAGIEIDINGVRYKTDEDGYYKVESAVTNGDYVIKVADNKYDSSPKSIPVTKVTSDKDNLDFEISGQFIGKVTYNGKPLKNVIVNVSDIDEEFKSDAQGMFKVPDLGLNKQYTISISSKGYTFNPKEKIINSLMKESNYQEFKAENEKYNITVKAVRGTVPLEKVDIKLDNATYKTDKSGTYVIKGVTGGSKYIITASKSGMEFAKSKQIIDKLQQDETVYFEGALNVSGKVLNGVRPLKDAVVLCNDKTAKTDVNGKYILKNLAPHEDYSIRVSSDSFVFKKQEIEISDLSNDLENINFAVLSDEEEPEAIEEESKPSIEIVKEDKSEKERIKAEKAEAERLAKEEKLRAAEEAKAEAERIKAEKEEAARLAKEEKQRAKEEAEEQARLNAEIRKLEAEEKMRLALEEKRRIEEEKKARIEAEKAEKERLKAEKEEAERLAREEKIRAAEEAKAEAERIKAEKEEAERLAKEEKIRAKQEAEEQARLEAELKKLEEEERQRAILEEKQRIEEEKQARIEAEKAEKERIKAEKEEAERLAREEKLRAEEEARLEKERIKAEKEELERLVKEEKERAEEQARLDAELKKLELEEQKRAEEERLKAEKEEAERLAKEEKERAEEAARLEAERIMAEKEEAERLAKEEKERAEEAARLEAERIKAEKEEAERIAKEEKLRAEEEARAEKERLKAEKEEAARIAKEEKQRAAEEAKIKKVEKEEISNDVKKETFYIEGRVLKSKFGVKGVQVRLLLASEEKIYLTDKNGYYKIAGLEKGQNYLITVLSGKEILNISPKSRTYKNLSGNMKNQNFYVVEKIVINKNKKPVKKTKVDGQEQDWNTRYGLENSNGIIKKDIEW